MLERERFFMWPQLVPTQRHTVSTDISGTWSYVLDGSKDLQSTHMCVLTIHMIVDNDDL